MKKKFLFLMALLAVSLFALAEMTVSVYKKDGTRDLYVAATVDSIGFIKFFIINFNANGGSGNMNVIKISEGETITLPDNTFTNGSLTFAGWNTQADGTGTAYADKASVNTYTNLTLYAQWDGATGIADGHEWVDLGLPSGTKWATCNVGATTPEKPGNYYQWGETTPKSISYSYSYNYLDNPSTLPLERDAAYVNWGSSWRMPTVEELDELIKTSYTTWTWTSQNGVNGYKITSKTNGKSIFLPAAGYRNYSDERVGTQGRYWTSSLYTSFTNDAYFLYFDLDEVSRSRNYRDLGHTVRPVLRE